MPIGFPLLLTRKMRNVTMKLSSGVLPRGFGRLYSTSVDCLRKRDFGLCPSFRAKNSVSMSGCGSNRQNNSIGVHTGVGGISGGALTVARVPCKEAAAAIVSSVLGTMSGKGVGMHGMSSGASTGMRVLMRLTTKASSSGAVSTLCTFASYRMDVSPGYYIVSSGGPRFLTVDSMLEGSTSGALSLLHRRLRVRGNRLRRDLRFTSLRGVFVRRHVCGSGRFRRSGSVSTTYRRVSGQLAPFCPRFVQRMAGRSVLGLVRVGVKHVLGFGSSGTRRGVTGVGSRVTRVSGRLTGVIRCAVD